jgi:spore coat polysaccharide biosynthesis predicted glycosyltransferase SpsG/CMP-N-acetylneuraminic acid synthetase
LIAGKPLLAHTIESARSARCFSGIFVSTEDDELAEIAHRFGADVIPRPLHLADDQTTLDEVVDDVYKQLSKRTATPDFHYVATIQATSPLLSSETIKDAVSRCRQGDCDTVLTVVSEPHLGWTFSGQRPVPLYEARLNRQELPPHYRETGGIVVCSVEQLEKGTRFGEKVELIQVSKQEAIDIDDYFDWWIAERALLRKNILFHVVGNRQSGLGHVYRALTLAYRLPAHHVRFLVNREASIAVEMLASRHQKVDVVDVGAEAQFIIDQKPDLLINDVLDTSLEFMSAICRAGIATVNFEDRGPGSRLADRLINAMYSDKQSEEVTNAFHGIEYCCLRDEFYSVGPISPASEVKNVLLLFGGTDPSGLTHRSLRWIDNIPGAWTITVAVGPGYHDLEELFGLVDRCKHDVTVVQNTAVISKHMKRADVALTSAGRTVFELAAMAIPMIVIAQNRREESHTFARTTKGAIYLGRAEHLSEAMLTAAIGRMLSSRAHREEMSRALSVSDVRGGIQRVIDIIEGVCREASIPQDNQT